MTAGAQERFGYTFDKLDHSSCACLDAIGEGKMTALKVPIRKYDRIDSLRADSGYHSIRPDLGALSDSIIWGDCSKALSAIPSESVNCIITSPPYYNQRDYGISEQIGGELRPEQYLANLRVIFRECRRVLSNDGVLWLNLGDKFSDGRLMGMPWRAAFSLVDDGWLLRSDVIWHTPNAMPSSVATRPTTDHEYLFLFSKSDTYRYFADAIREPHVTFSEHSKMRGGRGHFGKNGGTPEKGKNAGTQIFTRVAGTRRFIRWAETNARLGPSPCQSFEVRILRCSPRSWLKHVCWQERRGATLYSIPFAEVAQPS